MMKDVMHDAGKSFSNGAHVLAGGTGVGSGSHASEL
jgi:hypothetical protein